MIMMMLGKERRSKESLNLEKKLFGVNLTQESRGNKRSNMGEIFFSVCSCVLEILICVGSLIFSVGN